MELSPKGDKPHSCELCNKRFALACNLRAHMKTHEGEAQEECTRCGKNFLVDNKINNSNCQKCNKKILDSANEESSGNQTEDSINHDN